MNTTVTDPKLKTIKEPFEMTLKAFPNPSGNYFTLRTTSTSKEMIMIRVVDVTGRVVLATKIIPGQPYRFGDWFRAGTYMVEAIQDDHQKAISVIKMN